jgi:mannose-6-phosphate isomerase
MWYVVDCEEGAELIYGFKEDISKEEFERRIKDNTLTDVCNFVPVKKGDVFFITAGTLHAIGEGILIAEVQQNSNTTYRVSDYGRIGADGKPRPLHIEKALDVTKCEVPQIPYGKVGEVKVEDGYSLRDLAACDKFSAKLLSLNGKYAISLEDSFTSLIVLEGNAAISCNNRTLNITKGDSVFIPAGLEVELNGAADILYSYV